MNRKHCLILTKEEVRTQLKTWLYDMSEMIMDDVIEGRNKFPAFLFQKGIAKLTCNELVELAQCGWADWTLDVFNTSNKENPAVAVIMTDFPTNNPCGQSYLLTSSTIFRDDFERSPIKE